MVDPPSCYPLLEDRNENVNMGSIGLITFCTTQTTGVQNSGESAAVVPVCKRYPEKMYTIFQDILYTPNH